MMARVRRATRIPVTAGQSEITEPRRAPARSRPAPSIVVNVDASECGGVTEWRRAAAALRGRRASRWRTTRSRRSPGTCSAAVPHGTYAECFADPERDPVWQTMWAESARRSRTA